MSADTPHLSDERLLLLVDGELTPRRAEAARRHLRICPPCRARFERIEASAAAFGRAYRHGLDAQGVGADPLRDTLKTQLAELNGARTQAVVGDGMRNPDRDGPWPRVRVQPERTADGARRSARHPPTDRVPDARGHAAYRGRRSVRDAARGDARHPGSRAAGRRPGLQHGACSGARVRARLPDHARARRVRRSAQPVARTLFIRAVERARERRAGAAAAAARVRWDGSTRHRAAGDGDGLGGRVQEVLPHRSAASRVLALAPARRRRRHSRSM